MSTTAVFVEFVIVGMWASGWLAILFVRFSWIADLFFRFIGYTWTPQAFTQLDHWAFVVLLILIALWYTVGIVVDTIASAVGDKMKWLLRKFGLTKGVRGRVAQLHVPVQIEASVKAQTVYSYLEQRLSHLRIMRGFLLNVILTVILWLIFPLSSPGVVILGVAICIVLLIALGVLDRRYTIRASQVELVLKRGRQPHRIPQTTRRRATVHPGG